MRQTVETINVRSSDIEWDIVMTMPMLAEATRFTAGGLGRGGLNMMSSHLII